MPNRLHRLSREKQIYTQTHPSDTRPHQFMPQLDYISTKSAASKSETPSYHPNLLQKSWKPATADVVLESTIFHSAKLTIQLGESRPKDVIS
ncbi:hypothetical protein AVEN_74070-1 [Araneus ventricosus]|uniref:Uncharacterized protein n=1 Tax=Araneus ventricosus TaxID=182803 RepID=A0A4Y2PFD8_ARAVE|nr:hypothetical protein AVEN_74070-1 [Araneus ventricosus]